MAYTYSTGRDHNAWFVTIIGAELTENGTEAVFVWPEKYSRLFLGDKIVMLPIKDYVDLLHAAGTTKPVTTSE